MKRRLTARRRASRAGFTLMGLQNPVMLAFSVSLGELVPLVGPFFGFLTAFIFAVGILAVRGGAARKQGIPFVPFLAAGGLVALFFG